MVCQIHPVRTSEQCLGYFVFLFVVFSHSMLPCNFCCGLSKSSNIIVNLLLLQLQQGTATAMSSVATGIQIWL